MKGIINALDINASVRDEKQQNPFWILVRKEIAGHIRSWRFVILLVLVVLTFWGATAVAMNNIKDTVAKVKDLETLFLYLKILTTTEGTLPPFHVFLNF